MLTFWCLPLQYRTQTSVYQQIASFKQSAHATEQLISTLQGKVAELEAANQTANMQVSKNNYHINVTHVYQYLLIVRNLNCVWKMQREVDYNENII